jgi:hypothetical protein
MSEQQFDDWLKAALQQEPEPLDAGFSARVMTQLPAHAPRRAARPRFSQAMRAAELAAISLVAMVLSLVPLQNLAALDATLASVSLLALLLWWSLPQSRGSGWR